LLLSSFLLLWFIINCANKPINKKINPTIKKKTTNSGKGVNIKDQ